MSLSRREVLRWFAGTVPLLMLSAGTAMPDAPLRIGVIRAGALGSTFGRLWLKSGHRIMFSTLHAEDLRPMADELGPSAIAGCMVPNRCWRRSSRRGRRSWSWRIGPRPGRSAFDYYFSNTKRVSPPSNGWSESRLGIGASKRGSTKRTVGEKRAYVRDCRPEGVSVAEGCRLIGSSRSTYYDAIVAASDDCMKDRLCVIFVGEQDGGLAVHAAWRDFSHRKYALWPAQGFAGESHQISPEVKHRTAREVLTHDPMLRPEPLAVVSITCAASPARRLQAIV